MANHQRAAGIRIDLGGGLGIVELRREIDEDDRTWAEIRLRVPLTSTEVPARRQLIALLLGLRDIAADVAAHRRPAPRR